MIVYATGEKVRLQLAVRTEDEGAVVAYDDLHDAEHALLSVQSELGTADLLRYTEAVDAATDALRDMFSETLTIDKAESLHARLGAAIVNAKVAAGRFNSGEGE